jgi:hypothetical protein
MSNARMLQVWFGVVGMAAGLAVLLAGALTPQATDAEDTGIIITVFSAPSK